MYFARVGGGNVTLRGNGNEAPYQELFAFLLTSLSLIVTLVGTALKDSSCGFLYKSGGSLTIEGVKFSDFISTTMITSESDLKLET